ncbi:MAG TPA: VTT domain-containing protein [Stenomitos sp.]
MKKSARILQFLLLAGAVAFGIWLIRTYGLDIETLRERVKSLGVLAPLVLFGLRFISIVIPVIPGTAFAFVAGLSLGLVEGLLVISAADFFSCVLSFYLSRRYGKPLVQKLIGPRFMNRVEQLGQRHLERNFPLLTAFLMTGFFDFVSYGVGLTRTSWPRFLGALLISIPIAHSPIVIVGAQLLEKQQSYLVLGLALLIAFGVAIATGIAQRNMGDPA